MSDKMFERKTSLLQEFNNEVERMNEVDRKELELEYERLYGMECDDAVRIQTNDQFVETIKQAYENIQRSRKKIRTVEIYA
jgi:FKBP-type peptidyl-prolyl cis-trans isomerase 2